METLSSLVPNLASRNLLVGVGGNYMRVAIATAIQQVARVCLPLPDATVEVWRKLLEESVVFVEEDVRESGAAALAELWRAYGARNEKASENEKASDNSATSGDKKEEKNDNKEEKNDNKEEEDNTSMELEPTKHTMALRETDIIASYLDKLNSDKQFTAYGMAVILGLLPLHCLLRHRQRVLSSLLRVAQVTPHTTAWAFPRKV